MNDIRRQSVAFALGASAWLAPAVASATFFVVETTANTNDGLCSLPEAVEASTNMAPPASGSDDCAAGTGDDQIFVPTGTYTISSELVVGKKIAISTWAPASGTVIKTSSSFSNSQLFKVTTGGELKISDVTLQNGNTSGSIRGIYSTGGQHVWLERAVVTGFTNSGVVMADAPASGPSLTVFQTTIKSNSTTGDGGGLRVGLNVMLGVEYSLIRNNTAGGKGGGIFHRGWGNNNINYSTITANSATHGGGLYNNATGSGGNYLNLNRVTVANNSASNSGGGVVEDASTNNAFVVGGTIIANNTAPTEPNFKGDAHISGCVLGAVGHGAVFVEGDNPNLLNVGSSDLKLGSRRYMGGAFGSTEVLPLLQSSVALDLFDAEPSRFNHDQRQVAVQYSSQDAGAYEANMDWENEMLGYATFTGDNTPEVTDNPLYSGGQRMFFWATKVGDSMVVPIYFAEAGTYTVAITYGRDMYGGRFQIGTGPTATNITDFPTSFNGYSATPSTLFNSAGNRTFTAGTHYLRYKVTGKSASSSGYRIYPDLVSLIKR